MRLAGPSRCTLLHCRVLRSSPWEFRACTSCPDQFAGSIVSGGFDHLEFERRFIMGLLERVSTLIRANINDMVDRAEDPEKMIKQVILDMENQYLQVKTQVAVSIADQHMLEKKWRENEDFGKDWMRKAETAVDKSQDDLARAALDRFQTSQRLAQSYREQVDDQKAQVETLKGALVKLEQKLDEAKSKRDLLLARHRRGIALGKAARSEEHTSELQSPDHLVCRLLLEKKKKY